MMSFRATHFSDAALDALREVIRRELAAVQADLSIAKSRPLYNDDLAIARGSLPAASSTAPGEGTDVTLLFPASSGYSTDASDTVYNPSRTRIADGQPFPAFRDRAAGLWWALVGFGHRFTVGKLDAALAGGGSTTMTVWTHNEGSTWAASSEHIVVQNRFLKAALTISSTVWCGAISYGSLNLLIAAECT